MREPALSQRARFILLLVDVVILCAASWLALGRVFPGSDDKGFWFYTALLGLILGSRLDTPFFAKPADVVLYAAPAAIALVLGSSWSQWSEGIRVAYCIAIAYCVLAGVIGALAILTFESRSSGWQRASNAARILAETLGAPRTIYSVVIGFALYAFHGSSPREFGIIVAAWILTGVLSPIEGSIRIGARLRKLFRSNALLSADGAVVAYQTPGLMLIRQSGSGTVRAGDILAVRDPLRRVELALALDHVGRDEGILIRAIEVSDAALSAQTRDALSVLPAGAVACVHEPDAAIKESYLVRNKNTLVGLVAPETSVGTVLFEVVKSRGLAVGRLVEVRVEDQIVAYQLVNGATKEEIVQQRNTHGFAQAQAQKIGQWDTQTRRFKNVRWLPAPNSPVLLRDAVDASPTRHAIGHFPGTDYDVSIKSIDDLVTHNAAILGILGIGKSMLALELVERMAGAGVKVICIDLTNQYTTELASYIDATSEAAMVSHLQTIGTAGKKAVHQNVEEGGSRREFTAGMNTIVGDFMNPTNPRLVLIFNPTQYEVWRQDSKPFSGSASMASLSPAEITQIISHAALEAATALGMTDKARVCLVYEEAHSLVPEWNSAVHDGDKAAANGTARAILQGRKYGLGCLVVAQRTANVTKTILNQCNTIFAMRTFDDTGKDFLSNFVGADYANSLPSLSERQAVFFGRASSCENPILIQLNDRSDFIRTFRTARVPES